MFVLDALITIGNYTFTHVNEVRVESSRKKLLDTAVIKLPRKYKSNIITSVLKEGDAVTVKLGYNGRYNDEFTGYVLKIGCNTPVEIQCEDSMFVLKRSEVPARSWKTVTLKEIVEYVAPGSVSEVPDVTFSNYSITGKMNAAKVLESLKDQYNLDVYYRPDGKLYVGIGLWEKANLSSPNINYDTTLNVISSQLTYRRAHAVRIKLRMESHMPNGKLVTYESGDIDGETRTSNEYNLSLPDLKKLADTRIKEYKFDGLEGSIATFGEPFVRHGMLAGIHDPIQPGYDGSYIINSVATTFGLGGFRREVSLGRRIS